MQVDTRYLREQYSALSDEALQAINRSELVDAAQQLYDAELERRGLARGSSPKHIVKNRPAVSELAEDLEEDGIHETLLPIGDEEEPDWLPDAAEVFSRYVQPGALPAVDIADARDALESAGIPCYLEGVEDVEDARSTRIVRHRLRLLVPGELNLHAVSVLDREIFNGDFEAQWKAHLQTLSDDEVLAMKPEDVFCGLFDRIERINRVYGEELARRGFDPEPQ